MSITITGQFDNPLKARQARERLSRRGYIVSGTKRKPEPIADPLLIAHPYGFPGGNTSGNGILASLPIMAGNGVMVHTSGGTNPSLVSVLTDDTQARDVRELMKALGAKIL